MSMSAQTCQHRDLIVLLLWNTELVQDSKLILRASYWQAQHRPFAVQSVIKDTNIVFLLLIRLYLSWFVDESYFDSITLQNSVKLAKCQCDKDTNRNDCSSWNRWNWCVVLVMLFRQQHTVCVTESDKQYVSFCTSKQFHGLPLAYWELLVCISNIKAPFRAVILFTEYLFTE